METSYPLIIVFYLDAELIKQQEIMQPFARMIDDMLIEKKANAMAFFLPTTGEERVECINPTVVAEADMEKVNTLVEDIKTNFMVDVDVDDAEGDIIIEANETPTECGCGGNCQCNKKED